MEFTEVYFTYHLDLCHYYEVIKDSAPCKLYFDIDVWYTQDAEVEGVSLVEVFTRYVNHCLLIEYGIHVDSKEVITQIFKGSF